MIAHISLSKRAASQGVSTVVDQFESDTFFREGHRTYRPSSSNKELNLNGEGSREKPGKSFKNTLKNIKIVYFIFMFFSAFNLVRKYKTEISECKLIVCHDVFVLFFALFFLDNSNKLTFYNHSDSTPFNTLRKNFSSTLITIIINALERFLAEQEISTVYSLSLESSRSIKSCLRFHNCTYKIVNNFIVNENMEQHVALCSVLPNIWMIGTVCDRKRQLDFFELLASNQHLQDKLMDINFNVYGPIESKSKAIIERYSFVRYLGVVNDVTSHLSSGDILLSVSSDEGLPMSMIEAASKSLIIISTDVGGCNRICKSDYNGLLFDYKITEISRMLDYISKIRESEKLRCSLAQNSFLLYRDEFSQESAIKFWQKEITVLSNEC
jgi:glycosyltransferase involved in cell wall biosynthesis